MRFLSTIGEQARLEEEDQARPKRDDQAWPEAEDQAQYIQHILYVCSNVFSNPLT